ncbi:Receptor-binding cancer antigen expressed on SiSo cells [Trichoplax sp. H2]|uniref:Receptor-binding cancer antigen expressed on SiSo cells n=1 Tax=Trichoplax adhaerens TaxID=10228 RepID=B3S1Z5_TRIAD|nr:predicted protein [Trichoplax adhaerens]EDV23593.1 predicted protein [Trichoplax adhaerens]RDD44767.1 Receptor-binding cancer antigen expressed on SiSo cells [Trichoplax sp. H2]|eukprot:XP_002114503.1 predicted protein [Trichoplax adhaerens]
MKLSLSRICFCCSIIKWMLQWIGIKLGLRRLWKKKTSSEESLLLDVKVTPTTPNITDLKEDEDDIEGDTWDSWNNSFGVTVLPNQDTNLETLPKTEAEELPHDTVQNNVADVNEEMNNAPNFFEDLEPVIQKQAKYIIAKNENPPVVTNKIENKFVINDKMLLPEDSGLGVWDEKGAGWEDDAEEFDSIVESAVKGNKKALREKRMIENQRKKQELEAKKLQKGKSKRLATKMNQKGD